MIPELDNRLWFPDPEQIECDDPALQGLVAVGGDLSVDRLLLAYRSGIFPWSDLPITWWSPDPRGILELDNLHIPRRLQPLLRRQHFRVTYNAAFRCVIEACAQPAPGRERSWITPGIVAAYTDLHQAGWAHSVECWRGNQLAGGLYGVAINGFFAGESMFHHVTNASKIAVVALVRHLQTRRFQLLDLQMLTPVTQALGATSIARSDYLLRLQAALQAPTTFTAP